MQIDPKKAERALLKKGFAKSEGDHHYYVFTHNDKIYARTKMSHNDQTIGNHLIAAMARQCQLSKSDFVDLVKCPLSKERYLEILLEKSS